MGGRKMGRVPAVKGILKPEDALSALKSGADTIIVSNHGGGNSTAQFLRSTVSVPLRRLLGEPGALSAMAVSDADLIL